VDETPPAVAAIEEVVEAAGAHDVADDLVDRRALGDRHLRLRDGAITHHVDRAPAEEVQDARPALEALPAHADELGGRPLEPRGHHPAVVMPDRREALPVAGVAPDRPVLDELADREAVSCHVCHVVPASPPVSRRA
jgi:hypothetical protein